MLRHVAAAVIIVGMVSSPAFAQSVVITVTAASADVHKSPSTGSPVIGHTARGAQLPVTRELGSWVRVEWPSVPDGIGFVHVSMGRVGERPAAGPSARRGRRRGESASEKTAALTPPAASATVADRTPARRPSPSTPVPHLLGIGGGMIAASPVGFGVTARAWRWNRLGIRFDMSRQSEGVATAAHASSLQFEPSAIVMLNDYISNYVWLRPYAGGGVGFRHRTLTTGLTGASTSTANNSTGYQLFGGTEVTVANAPQLAVSTDLIYRSPGSDDVLDSGGVGIGLSAHWYFR